MKNEIETLKDDLIYGAIQNSGDYRGYQRVTRAYEKGDLELLRAYDRILSPGRDADNISNMVEVVRRFASNGMVSRVGKPHFDAYVAVMKSLYLLNHSTRGNAANPNQNDDLHQTIGWLAICHPHRVDDITAILTDRGITDPAVAVSLFMDMGTHHSSLNEGVL